MKLLCEWHLMKHGVASDSRTWKRYPAAVPTIEKNEILAFTDGAPNASYVIGRSNGRVFHHCRQWQRRASPVCLLRARDQRMAAARQPPATRPRNRHDPTH
ncbi:protein of unknown function [Rhodovastum atsumiense]|nr:protein of unknown function [Rhodovastum atsumiense]